jgi:RNA polymerase sigma-70 factor (ECF subfamily)
LSNQLIQQARSGDEVALRKLYEEHRPRVMRLAYAMLGDAAEAEDVVQDVMVYALTHLDKYDPERGAFTTWLHTIAVSRTRDRGRRIRLHLSRLQDWMHRQATDHAPGPESALDGIDAVSRIGPALAELTRLQREAVVLREVEGLSYKEIGEVLDIPMRTAQARVVSAHAALRRSLGATGDAAASSGSASDE